MTIGLRRADRGPQTRRASGFTLLEVMVALALLAGALMAVADLCGNALRNHVYARDLAETTLLARGKMAELEQKYEDEGFKDFDQTDEGDFSDAKRPDVYWRVDLIRPAGDLSADQLVSMLTGMGGDAQGMIPRSSWAAARPRRPPPRPAARHSPRWRAAGWRWALPPSSSNRR